MIKRFPSSRNQRSKGIKVKHVLQVMLLLGVCFWLIYQVKHNHDKKKEFDNTNSKLSVKTETDQILKLGRKDLHPGKDEVNQNEKHEEEEEDEHIVEDAESKHEHDEQQQEEEGHKHETEESEVNIHEGREQEEEENKHEAEEQEEDESKIEEVEDERGDAETDENDHEKSDVDNDRDDEVIDEEKEKEEEGDETENEDKEDEEKGGLVENQDNHEAREEHYKGDDVSSAVAHETHATSTETETINLEHSGVNLAVNIRKPDIETTYSDESNKNQNDSDLKVNEGDGTDGISSNTTAGKDTGNDSLSNETSKTNTDINSNLTAVTTEASSNLTSNDMSSSSEQNKTAIILESDHTQNATATANTTITGDIQQAEGSEQNGNKILEENLPDNNSTLSVKPENGDAAPGESSTLRASELEKTIGFVASNRTENISSDFDRIASSDTTQSDKSKGSIETSEANETQNIDATEDEIFKGDTQTGETDEKSDSSFATTEISDSVEHDAIDSSDTHIHEDMEKARTDLDTLPDIRNEGNEDDENAAE
ncbi:uncharacterized protein [Cicer arietinum]|uniref:Cilia- and flagella-associated protein 251-like n=1 Tax=Cicer arietinum TaxID=3827 RepID=A0A1S2XZ81_CICAR|nr:cilia- and flagella-associated protein 251-like [Cicer arietinum]